MDDLATAISQAASTAVAEATQASDQVPQAPNRFDFFKALVTSVFGRLRGIPALFGIVAQALPVRVTVVGHLRFYVEIEGMEPRWFVDEEVEGSVDSLGNVSLTPKVPFFGIDNGDTPSVANAASQMVKIAQAQHDASRAAAIRPVKPFA